MYRKIVSLILALFCSLAAADAAVSITAGSGGTGICSNKAVSGSAPGYSSLGSITITEGVSSDFAAGTDVIVLHPPSGWRFSTTLPSLTFITGSNITGMSGSITASALTINITVAATTGADQITITGLQVQPLTTSAGSGNVYAASVTGVTGIATGTGGNNFATLSVASPVTAAVSIAATPSGAFCPGTHITFIPTSANGGTPTYTWAVNGTDVSIGSTFTSSTLSTGNTVSCRMVSSLGCLVANPVYSNTITATVLTAPAALTGSNQVCPGVTTTFSTTSTGGAWSSSNTSVATVSGGVVTGVTAGTSKISYTAGGCAATRVIYVNELPFAPALTPTVSTICDEGAITISASGSAAPTTILTQDFNSGLSPWTVDTAGSTLILPGSEWKACADSYLNEQGWYRSPDYTTFVMANADTSGSSSTLSAKLTSPEFSLAEYSSATLTFQHSYDYWPSGDVYVNLEISTNGGASWTTINNFIGETIGAKMAFVGQSYSLNAYLGNPHVKIRFYYRSTFGYYWAIDNISLTGVPAWVVPTWSPSTHLYLDAGYTMPYTAGTPISTVYMHPTSVTTPTFITYTATATSGACSNSATSAVTVNPAPGTTLGSMNLCVGTTTTLSNTAAGGTWLSANTSVATVVAGTGVVTGVAAGTATISYILGTSCAALAVVTVNTTPAAITGGPFVCMGTPTTLENATTGGSWSSSNPSVATVGSSTGVVSGVSLGAVTIVYSLGAGCTVTKALTVQPSPAAITGPAELCAGDTVTVTDATSGGIWVSGGTGIATIGYYTGDVIGVSAGTVNITYGMPTTGCLAITNMTVNPIGPITGSGDACIGYTNPLDNIGGSGTWVSGNVSVATVGASTGLLTGVATGTSMITYTSAAGCVAHRVITVNELPTEITGTASVCIGQTTALANATSGGTWSSSDLAVATVGSSTGIVSGGTAGTVEITYTAPSTCISTIIVTVNPLPVAITGSATICDGFTSALSNASSGGTWSSSNAAVATVGASGVVTAESEGTATITYTLPTGCYGTRGVTVNPLPAAITGTASVCQGQTTSLATITGGGIWSSSHLVVATVGSTSGSVLGGASGTATISYTLSTGCVSSRVVTVNPLPGSLSGASVVCTGTSTSLTTSSSGGTWTSSNTSVATVGATGAVTGVAAGNVVISYTLPTGCYSTKSMTVNSSPAAISGATGVCVAATTTLSSTTASGAWSSSNTSVAAIVSGTGVVTGIAAGTATITYMLSTGCIATRVTTVLPLPASISGSLSLCLGNSTSLSNSTGGGTWSTSNPTVANISSTTGVVTGMGLGTATISYTLPTGCYTSSLSVVNPLPAAVSGASALCVGSSTVYTDGTSGGVWSSSNTAIANIGSVSGAVTGVAAGTSTISYTLSTGCAATQTLTVNALPSGISGPDNICQTASASMTNPAGGGLWTSSTISVATVGSASGVVYGVAGGVAVITYTLPTGCKTAKAVTVTALPAAISGSPVVCEGSTILYSDATAGGSWISGNTSVATIESTGLLTGVNAGTSNITYMLPLGCVATKVVTVNSVPAAVTGNANLCLAAPQLFETTTTDGGWASSSPSVVSINITTGVATGYVYGAATISYILPTGCYAIKEVTVNLTPSSIAGSGSVCEGLTTPFSNAVSGGSWTSSDATIASVNSATGVVSGVSAGTATITYTLSTGCFKTKQITVNPVPEDITGPAAMCQGLAATLSTSSTGGTWSSGSTFVAIVGVTTGVVNGISPGTANITYKFPTGCQTTRVMTVYALPSSISGAPNLCIDGTTTLSTASSGGTWTSSIPAVATVDGTGVVTGETIGTSRITYTLGIGCSVSKVVTVHPNPPTPTGADTTCLGITVPFSNTLTGGVWSSSASSGIVTVGSSSGVVTPVAPGVDAVTYTLGTGCYSTKPIVVNTVTPIIGSTSICIGALSMLSHATPGGTWSSSNTAVVGISPTSGNAVGYSVNTATISYVLPSGCIATTIVSVNTLPPSISGLGSVCPGFNVSLFNAAPDGVWSSSNATIASVGSSSGIVTGVAPGLVAIQYLLPTGCSVSRVLTVNSLPATIVGNESICAGNSAVMTIAATGGTWSSSDFSVASIGATTGVVSGIAAGTATITYTPSSGCLATHSLTVNDMPSAISGAGAVCSGTMGTFTNTTAGGTWSSVYSAVVSVDTATGVYTALAPGTAIISYTLGVGCAATSVLTVNVMPGSISGIASVCAGYTTSLSSSPSGGIWTSGNTSAATINSTTGVVTGVAGGTSTITYGFPSGCEVYSVVTISPMSATIAGVPVVCEGATTTLSDPAAGGGTWSSSNSTIAAVDMTSGSVTGVSSGTATITYTIGSGCVSVKEVTVNPIPMPIAGIPSACLGMSTALSDLTAGGTWSSSDATVATIGSSTGIVNAVSAGVSDITYQLPTGCLVSQELTVNPAPGTTSGVGTVCAGSNTVFTNSVIGGVWSSGSPSIASVDPITGIATGVSGGVAEITYLMGAGCLTSTSLTVYPVPASISGSASVCQGQVVALSNATGGGTWGSSNGAVASIGLSDGIVSGIAPGTTTIAYTIGTGCAVELELTVNPLAANTGFASTCVGFSTVLSNAISGGTWSTGSAVASVDAAGSVTGLIAGIADITYELPTGCRAITAVTVSSVSPITGSSDLCVGQPVTFSNSSSGGTWTSGDATVAAVDAATGTVTGITTGSASISYYFGGGCVAVKDVTVSPLAPIVGSDMACVGQTSIFTDAVTGGTWSSAETSVVVDASTGAVTGVAVGTAVISYRLPSGCTATKEITVNPLSDIIGPDRVCEGSSITLSNATPGGSWSTASPAIITADISTGDITGVSFGEGIVSYQLPSGCRATHAVTVNPLPDAISGSLNVCLGLTSTLSSSSVGGSWSSSDVAVASVDMTSGVVTGLTTGTTEVSYTLPTGCVSSVIVTVNALPDPISGTLNICQGGINSLTNSSVGGTWASDDLSIATIDATTGSITGVTPGTASVIYTLGTGCIVTAVVTVNPLPPAISGAGSICVGESTTLSNPAAGGTWSSVVANVSVGSLTGVVTGVAPGLASVVYTLPTGCRRTLSVFVNALPLPVSGSLGVCQGATSLLSSGPSGGTWSSDDPAIASVDPSSGLVSGNSTGTSFISYTLPTGCSIASEVTVNTLPGAISGAGVVCQGHATPLSVSIPGGSWLSSDATVATVDGTGVVTGVNPGLVTITYTLPTGCISTRSMTVNGLPAPITGVSGVCAGQTTSLYDASPGGVWISGATGIASVDVVTGEVTGVSVGTAEVTYSLSSGCTSTRIVTVNLTPAPIAGPSTVCVGSAVALTNTTGGGIWSAAAPAVATVGGGGSVTGVSVGVANISYTLPSGCGVVREMTVNALPPPITGAGTVCPGQTLSLSNSVSGGTWNSSAAGIATIDVTSGVVTGMSGGVVVMTYTLPTGCYTHAVVIVDPAPAAITGVGQACVGASAILSCATSGGFWYSSASSVASVDAATGVVTAATAGTATISYRMSTGCFSESIFTVNPLPPAIAGSSSACLGAATALYNSVPGGTWTSSDPTIATVDIVTGDVTGVAFGSATITYALPTGCRTSLVVSVHPLPAVITGVMRICQGNTTLLSDATGPGSWSSGDTSIIVADAASGVVMGVSAGTALVYYTTAAGCSTSAVVTVDALLPVVGTNLVCAGDTVHFSCGVPGGSWSSSTLGVATVSDTGTVAGVGSGVAVISYRLSSGCVSTRVVTVNPLPVGYFVTGGGSFCTGAAGVPVGLSGSLPGFGYHLNNGSTPVSYLAGTGSVLNYGLQSVGGVYSVRAVNLTTGCSRTMVGTATVTPVALAPATVSVFSSGGDTVCNSTSVTYSPVTYLAGTSPSYQWYVNSTLVGSAGSYSYSPSDGDTITCKLHSSASCAVPDTATGSLVMTVLPLVGPSVSVSVIPGDTICNLATADFTATPVNGGSTPLLRWMKNGSLAATGATYGYTPLDGDDIVCELVSDARCRLVDTVRSIPVYMTVLPFVVPTVTINAAPGFSIDPGQEVTFSALVADAGATPGYQWLINSTPVPGATNSVFVTSTLVNGDTVKCKVSGSGRCPGVSDDFGEVITVKNVGVGSIGNNGGLTLSPNPNSGLFHVYGMVDIQGSVNLQISDMLGRVVFEKDAETKDGRLDEYISVDNVLANGMYLLTVRSDEKNYVFHVTITR